MEIELENMSAASSYLFSHTANTSCAHEQDLASMNFVKVDSAGGSASSSQAEPPQPSPVTYPVLNFPTASPDHLPPTAFPTDFPTVFSTVFPTMNPTDFPTCSRLVPWSRPVRCCQYVVESCPVPLTKCLPAFPSHSRLVVSKREPSAIPSLGKTQLHSASGRLNCYRPVPRGAFLCYRAYPCDISSHTTVVKRAERPFFFWWKKNPMH